MPRLTALLDLNLQALHWVSDQVGRNYSAQHTINSTDFVRKELNILGSRNALRVFPSVIKMLAQHDKPFSELISRVYPFQETPRVQRLGGCAESFHQDSDRPQGVPPKDPRL
jgi:hypothetical protein